VLRIRELGVPGDFEMVEQLRTTTRPVTLPGGLVLTWTKSELNAVSMSQIEPFGFSSGLCKVTLGEAGELDWAGVRFHWALEPVAPGKARIPATPGAERFDARKVGGKVILRHWQPGDRFQPIGMPSAVKLQDLWVNMKIPRIERASRIVATTGEGEVFWVEGLRIGERFKLDKTTRQQLKWSWNRL
jgi:tRNA(Ile)-lysidine synthetase-like protein